MDLEIFLQAVLLGTPEILLPIPRQMMGDCLPVDYLATLSVQDRLDALRACLMIYALSSNTIIPRIFQLQASLTILNGRDTMITTGTGSGKTLCLLIPMLLRPQSISITISPLKRLQMTQVSVITI